MKILKLVISLTLVISLFTSMSSNSQTTQTDTHLRDSIYSIDYKKPCKKKWYYKKNNTNYTVCEDRDGIIVTWPGGSNSYGKGYDINDVKDDYGFRERHTRKAHKKFYKNCTC